MPTPRPTPREILSEVLSAAPLPPGTPVAEAPNVTVDWIVTLVLGVTMLVKVGDDGAVDRSRRARAQKEISGQGGLRTSAATANTSAAVSIGRDPLGGELEPAPVTVVTATTVVVGEEESSVVSATLAFGALLREQ